MLQLLQKVTLPFGVKYHLLFDTKLYYTPNNFFFQWTNWSFLPAIVVQKTRCYFSGTFLYDMVVNDAVWFNSVWLKWLVKLELIPALFIQSIPFCLTLLNLICKDSALPLRLVGNLFLWSGVFQPFFFHFGLRSSPWGVELTCDFCSSCCAVSCQAQHFALAKNKTAGRGGESHAELGKCQPLAKCGNWYLFVLSFPPPPPSSLHLLSHAHLGKVFGAYLLLSCVLPFSGSCVIRCFGNKNGC